MFISTIHPSTHPPINAPRLWGWRIDRFQSTVVGRICLRAFSLANSVWARVQLTDGLQLLILLLGCIDRNTDRLVVASLLRLTHAFHTTTSTLHISKAGRRVRSCLAAAEQRQSQSVWSIAPKKQQAKGAAAPPASHPPTTAYLLPPATMITSYSGTILDGTLHGRGQVRTCVHVHAACGIIQSNSNSNKPVQSNPNPYTHARAHTPRRPCTRTGSGSKGTGCTGSGTGRAPTPTRTGASTRASGTMTASTARVRERLLGRTPACLPALVTDIHQSKTKPQASPSSRTGTATRGSGQTA